MNYLAYDKKKENKLKSEGATATGMKESHASPEPRVADSCIKALES